MILQLQARSSMLRQGPGNTNYFLHQMARFNSILSGFGVVKICLVRVENLFKGISAIYVGTIITDTEPSFSPSDSSSSPFGSPES